MQQRTASPGLSALDCNIVVVFTIIRNQSCCFLRLKYLHQFSPHKLAAVFRLQPRAKKGSRPLRATHLRRSATWSMSLAFSWSLTASISSSALDRTEQWEPGLQEGTCTKRERSRCTMMKKNCVTPFHTIPVLCCSPCVPYLLPPWASAALLQELSGRPRT